MVVGRAHDLVPQFARTRLAVDPLAVGALVGALVHDGCRRLRLVRQLHIAIALDRLHEGVGNTDRDVEVGEVAVVFGVDELFDIGVVAAQHAHLRAAACAGRFDCLARAVEHTHVRHRAARPRVGALDVRTDRADRREVITDTTTAAHRFRRFGERGVNAGAAVGGFGDRIAHRLHEAIDQRGSEIGAGGRVDAACRDEAVLLRPEKLLFPMFALTLDFDGGQCASDAAAHFVHGLLAALGVFLDQHFARYFLFGHGRDFGKLLQINGFHNLPQVVMHSAYAFKFQMKSPHR